MAEVIISIIHTALACLESSFIDFLEKMKRRCTCAVDECRSWNKVVRYDHDA